MMKLPLQRAALILVLITGASTLTKTSSAEENATEENATEENATEQTKNQAPPPDAEEIRRLIDAKVPLDQLLEKIKAAGGTVKVRTTESNAAADQLPLPAAPEGTRRLMASVPASLLRGQTIILPKLYAFDNKSGLPVESSQLPEPLREYFKKNGNAFNAEAADTTPLMLSLKDALKPDGTPLTRSDFPTAEFVLVQFWAGWCSPCLQEGKELADIFRAHPMPNVQWIAVEKDNSKTVTSTSDIAPTSSTEVTN